eukprot:CAMPEP_0174826734 /NCGR_PEP_ID=MMETSP1114-20130205/174_1 /TAXON_ID=312471 /ORGANISM="Neobodo designis, Strain CCAP 1951/1" /LENGTH=618 /DNA_ID=CAMNT_0016060293 /DNA_START=45 /DNA_END=1901 /DNA_ORIENTATION=-
MSAPAAATPAVPIADDAVAPWAGAYAREPTALHFEPDGSAGVAPTPAAPAGRKSVAPPAAAAAASDESDDYDDDGAARAGVPPVGDGSEGSAAGDVIPAMPERKQVRRLLKGTTIYFQAASPRDVVLVQAVESGCKVVHKEEKGDIIWIEATPRTSGHVRAMAHERINFFPGMKVGASKCTFSTLMGRVAKLYPGDFPFIPRTFALPTDRAALTEHLKANPNSNNVWVVKPDGGCGGDGIYLTDNLTSLRHNECVVQSYVTNPLTIGGLKFDFRLYVAVTSIHPLRFYLHREGLARMAVLPYEKPAKANFYKLNMHLTNYSLNKFSNDFVENTDADDDEGTSKRKASTAMRQLAAEYGDEFDEEELWERITELVGKTLGAIAPHILATTGEIPGQTRYLTRCFQLLGFDVLVDRDMRPHLLEINNHPSLQTDAPIDLAVKGPVVQPLVRMAALDARVNRKRGSAGAFVPPTDAEYAAWEARFTEDGDLAPARAKGFMPCDSSTSAAISARYVAPLMPLLRLFVEACGGATGRTYDELSSSRFARLARRLEIAGPGKAFATPEVDLLFIKALQKKGGGNALEFYDFVDTVTGPIGDRISPHTPPGSLHRLRDVTAQLCS